MVKVGDVRRCMGNAAGQQLKDDHEAPATSSSTAPRAGAVVTELTKKACAGAPHQRGVATIRPYRYKCTDTNVSFSSIEKRAEILSGKPGLILQEQQHA
jgi:hypothetical protein